MAHARRDLHGAGARRPLGSGLDGREQDGGAPPARSIRRSLSLLDTMENQGDVYACPVCSELFYGLCTLDRHTDTTHPRILPRRLKSSALHPYEVM